MPGLPDMGKQVGPLPMGVWVAVVGGSFAYMMYQRNRAAATPAATNVDAVAADSIGGVGYGGAGAIGAYTPTDGGVSSPADSTGAITSNTVWGQRAFAFLAGQGTDGSTVDAAIRNYLSGLPLSVQQNALITQALSKFGMVPETLPDAPALPQVPVATPAPVTVPSPVAAPTPAPAPAPAPPVGRTHTVVQGETLSGIASKFWEPWITWRTIYAANRGTIGGNPDRIKPGQVLTIA